LIDYYGESYGCTKRTILLFKNLARYKSENNFVESSK